MKRVLYILLMLSLPLVVSTGCNNQEPDVFEKNSSQRVQELIDSAFKTLTSSEEGWYFDYSPGWTSNYQYGGYWMWCKFTKEYEVTAATEAYYTTEGNANVYPTATSSFDIIRGRGAVLSFNMYNAILDLWATPSQQQTQALQGDTEFQIASVTDDVVSVIGIKTGTMMNFYRKKDNKSIKDVFDGITDDAYFAPAFNATIPGTIKASVARKERLLTLKYSYETDKKDKDGKPVVESKTIEISSVPKLDGTGILLSKPLEFTGLDPIKSFTYDAANLKLVSDENSGAVVLTFPVLNELVNYLPLKLSNTKDNMCAKLIDAWASGEAANSANYDESLTGVTFDQGVNDDSGAPDSSRALIFNSLDAKAVVWSSFFKMVFSPVEGTEDQVEVEYTGMGFNAEYYTWFEPFAKLIDKDVPENKESEEFKKHNGTKYTLTTDNKDNPTWIKFTSQSDSAFFFTVSL